MKQYFGLIVIATILSVTIAAPYEYSSPTEEQQPQASSIQQKPKISALYSAPKFVKSNVVESATNPLQDKKYQFVKADCQNLGNEVQTINNKEFKIRKFGCVYPGDKPIPQDILDSVNEHFRGRVSQWANE